MDIEEEQQIEMKPEVAKPQFQKNKENMPWVEKYRPSSLANLISHKSIVETIEKFIEEKKLPNLLFYGPPGTGKTSTIVASARQMYGKFYQSMVLELNASDERGIEVVRMTIKDFASAQNLACPNRVKLVILDEADFMTSAAQFALRRVIEKYAKNARFCLICNYVSKIIQRFSQDNISFEDAKPRILEICESEKLEIENSAIEAVFQICDGDMRKAVNMLQSLSLNLGKQSKGPNELKQVIDRNFVYQSSGNVHPDDIQAIYDSLNNDDLPAAFGIIQSIKMEKGISMGIILKELTIKLMNADLPSRMKGFLIRRMAELEYRASLNCSEKFLVASLVGAFIESKTIKE